VVEFIYNNIIFILYIKNMSGIPNIHEEPIILQNINNKPHLYNIVEQQLKKRQQGPVSPTPNEIMRVINRMRKSRHLSKLYLDTDPGDLTDMFGFVGYQDVLTETNIRPLDATHITRNMDSIPLQFWINAKVANGSTPHKLIKQINRIRKEKGWEPVFLTKVGYDSIQSANTDDPSLNYTTNPAKRFEEKDHIGRKDTRKALKGFQKMSDSNNIGVFDPRLWGNTGGPFVNYLRKQSRNSKSSRSEESSDFSSENSANSSSSRRTKKARK
jgi:hypothetical protein